MAINFTLEYWIDDSWYVGRLKEVPGIFSQGETLNELKENIREVYNLMIEDRPPLSHLHNMQQKEIEITL